MKFRALSISILLTIGITFISMLFFSFLYFATGTLIPWELRSTIMAFLSFCVIPVLLFCTGMLGAHYYNRNVGTISVALGALVGFLCGLAGALVIGLFRVATIFLYNELFTLVEATAMCVGMFIWLFPGTLGGLIGGVVFQKTGP